MKQFLALFVVVFCFLAVTTASQSQAEQLTEELPSSEVRDHDQTNSLNENDQVERINQEQDQIITNDESLQELVEADSVTDKQTNTDLKDDTTDEERDTNLRDNKNDFDQAISTNNEESEIEEKEDENELTNDHLDKSGRRRRRRRRRWVSRRRRRRRYVPPPPNCQTWKTQLSNCKSKNTVLITQKNRLITERNGLRAKVNGLTAQLSAAHSKIRNLLASLKNAQNNFNACNITKAGLEQSVQQLTKDLSLCKSQRCVNCRCKAVPITNRKAEGQKSDDDSILGEEKVKFRYETYE